MNSSQLCFTMFLTGFALAVSASFFYTPLILLGLTIALSSIIVPFLPPIGRDEQYEVYKNLEDARHVHKQKLQKKEWGFEVEQPTTSLPASYMSGPPITFPTRQLEDLG